MKQIILSKVEARTIILHAAGLSRRAFFGMGREAVYKLINHLGFVQIDTQYVVERAHHHQIFSRIPDYQPEWLDELQADQRIFEYLTFATGFIPMHDYRFSLPMKAGFLAKRGALPSPEANLMNKVLERVSRDGPLGSTDFENDRVEASKGWWDWRPSKVALERLYSDGRLMTTRGRNLKKVYDLPMNIVPTEIDTTMPTAEEYARHVIRRALKALGIAYLKEIAYYAKFVKNSVKTEMAKMVESGEVCLVKVAGLESSQLYMLPSYKSKRIGLPADAFILSPFDVLNVFRHRLRDFFDFDYQVECFVPQAKRKYGYFSLPVLVGDTFVARMDSKADRKDKVLTIHNLHFEPVKLTAGMMAKVARAIKDFAKFNGCETIVLEKTNNKSLTPLIKKN